jgi:hypothetical protein
MESGETTQSISLVDMRKKPEERGLDKEEEDYFNKGRFVHFSFAACLC